MVVAADIDQPDAQADDDCLHRPGGLPGVLAAAQQEPLQADHQGGRQQAPGQSPEAEHQHVGQSRLGGFQVLASVPEILIAAIHIALRVLHIALLERLEGKRCRVGALEALAHAVQQHVQDAGHLVVVENLGGIHPLGGRQRPAKMQGVQQGDAHVHHDDREGHQTQAGGKHPPPAHPGLGVPAQAIEKQGQGDDQQKHQRVGPQQDGLEIHRRHQLSRTLGSAQV